MNYLFISKVLQGTKEILLIALFISAYLELIKTNKFILVVGGLFMIAFLLHEGVKVKQ